MGHLPPEIKNRIDNKLKRLNAFRPLPSQAVKKLQEQFQIEMTYNSNAIEGNRLTLKETFLVINEGITIKNKSFKDHIEAKNHYEALEFIADLIQHEKRYTMSEHLIKTLHQLVLHGTDKEWAGVYRNSNVIITGADHIPPDAVCVPQAMAELMKLYSTQKKRFHTIELAATLHHKFVNIHPFFDGNGRVGRLLMNVALMREGYPLACILKNDRKKYYDVLTAADKKDDERMIRFIARSVERSLDIYLKILTPLGVEKEDFFPLSVIATKTPYSAKYLNLLIRQDKLEAYKEGRNWVTSVKAVSRYQKQRQRKR